jgi:hypothetical protein
MFIYTFRPPTRGLSLLPLSFSLPPSGAEGIPVKLSVLADLLDVATKSGVLPPFDTNAVDLSGVKRVHVDRA